MYPRRSFSLSLITSHMNPGSGMEAKDGQPQSCPRPSTGQAKVVGASFLGVIPEPYDNVAQKHF